MKWSNLGDETRIALGGMADFASSFVHPVVRLGVTGLSRSGKTVFITALVHALLHGGKLPLFTAQARGRITRVYLEPQPDDDLPRFAYEDHIKALSGEERTWPQSTNRLSQLRLTVDYEPQSFLARKAGSGKLHIDIIDYPGEWLLDLPLLDMDYAQWSAHTMTLSRTSPRDKLSSKWQEYLTNLDPQGPANEAHAQQSAALFTAYLASCRDEAFALSTLPPGRFLMPGDLAGSPLLTFAPLDIAADATATNGSLHAMMERRYDAYLRHVVKPFFFDHFARLDRQVVLVDALSALNAGPTAVADLKNALSNVLAAYRQGSNSVFSTLFGKRIDRILFAASKTDLLHQDSHDRLENLLRLVVEDAAKRASFAGAKIDIAAIAAIRATHEAMVKQAGEHLPCIVGTPQQGEKIADKAFDGATEAAIFPGDLPDDPQAALDGSMRGALQFVRFRPPLLAPAKPLVPGPFFPHIRLDRAIEFLLGDRFS